MRSQPYTAVLGCSVCLCCELQCEWPLSLQCVVGTDTWQRVNAGMPVKSPRFALFDLAEGKTYSFRVRCCNSAGVGEPSEATEPTAVGDKLGEGWRRVGTFWATTVCTMSCMSAP